MAQPYAGGTAWDPIRNGVWISNGALLARRRSEHLRLHLPAVAGAAGCRQCRVTGLGNALRHQSGVMLDSFGNLYQMTYACPPAVTAICNTVCR